MIIHIRVSLTVSVFGNFNVAILIWLIQKATENEYDQNEPSFGRFSDFLGVKQSLNHFPLNEKDK